METKIQKNIIDYFSFFEEFFNTAKTCLKICQTCALSINKLMYRSEHIKESNLAETPLEKFIDLKAKLLTSLYNLITAEIQEIQTQLSVIEELFDKLCLKNKILQDCCKEIDFSVKTPLVTGTPLQPPLLKLLAFASDTVTFGSQVIGQIETALNVLSFKGLNTKKFTENFKFPSNWQNKIPEIIAYTSFCSENELLIN